MDALIMTHCAEAQAAGWVKTGDRLPMDRERVIAYWPPHEVWKHPVIEFCTFYSDSGEGDTGYHNNTMRGFLPVYWSLDELDYPVATPSHWMPEPSGPDELCGNAIAESLKRDK